MDERSLITQLCRLTPEKHLRQLIATKREKTDWMKWCQLADQHYLLPTLHKNLKVLGLLAGEFLPPEAVSYIESRRHGWMILNTLVMQEFGGIAETFELEGIPTLALKGPVLAELVYDDISLRPFFDLDFVIHPPHRARVKSCLTTLGYRYLGNERVEEDYYTCERPGADRRVKGLWLDIHYRMRAHLRMRGRCLDMDEIWDDSVPYKSELCRRPSWEDFLCHLAIHASLDSYSRFILVCDIDRLLRTGKSINWSRVVDKATRYRCKTDLWIALRLARLTLGTPVPEEIAHFTEVGILRKKILTSFLNERNILATRGTSLVRFPFKIATTDRLTQLPDVLVRGLILAMKRPGRKAR